MSPVPQITLENDVAEIGGAFEGQVTYNPPPKLAQSVRQLLLTLDFQTSGDNFTDQISAFTTPIETDSLGNVNQTFTLPVTEDDPISYNGKIIEISWQITATADLAYKRDVKNSISVLVLPKNGHGLYQHPHPLKPTGYQPPPTS